MEVFLDAEFPRCDKVVRDAISCKNATDHAEAADAHHRQLAGGHSLCEPGTVESHVKAGCDGHKWAAAHTAHSVLLWTSVSILALFFLELRRSLPLPLPLTLTLPQPNPYLSPYPYP